MQTQKQSLEHLQRIGALSRLAAKAVSEPKVRFSRKPSSRYQSGRCLGFDDR